MRKSRKLSTLEKISIGILAYICSVAPSFAQEIQPFENPFKGQVPFTQNSSKEATQNKGKDSKVNFYLENTVATNYVFGSGMIIGRKDPKKHGGVDQTLLCATKDNLSAFVWSNYDFQDKELHEIDAGFDYTLPIGENFSVTGGYWFWNYPSKLLGEHGDQVIHFGMDYKGPVDISACMLHLMNHEDVESGECYVLKTSKDFSLGKVRDFDISITSSIEAGITNNFYDDTKGLRAITSGVDLKLEKGPFSIKGFYRHQDGKTNACDFDYGGISFGYAF